MLNPERVAALQEPISEESPAGDNLEYDSAFIALATASQGKAEQQFGDTVIAAVEPEWREVDEQAQSLLERTKDARVALLLLRANTRMQGIDGFSQGLGLIHGLLERYWDALHPQLDADDDNDPTMRLNALAPLADESTMLRDLYDAQIGVARGSGPLRVRDVAMAYGQLAPPSGEPPPSAAQIDGALAAIHSQEPQRIQTLAALSKQVGSLQSLLTDKTGRGDAVDLAPLRGLCNVLAKACAPLLATSDVDASDSGSAAAGESASEGEAGTATGAPAVRGDIRSRQDALAALDRVIHYLQQSEPGNPAPLLISRAKKLIGVSFMEIMADLAPGAIETIEGVTGKQQTTADDE